MLVTFLDKLGGFFDRRFVVAYWAPVLIGMVITGGVLVARLGRTRGVGWWAKLGTVEQFWLGIGALLLVTGLAYLLQAFTVPLIRTYEGYTLPHWLQTIGRNGQRRTWEQLRATTGFPEDDAQNETDAMAQTNAEDAYRSFFVNYLRDDALLRPTRLGNVITAAEEYAYQMYRLDSVLWWPRLITLIPEPTRHRIDDALTDLVALLNLCTVLTLTGLGGGLFLFLTDKRGWLFAISFLGPFVLGWLCYLSAVSQARAYADLVRTVFDLHRHDVLKQMHVPVPKNLRQERVLWTALNNWTYRYMPPWETQHPAELAEQENPARSPFAYDYDDTAPRADAAPVAAPLEIGVIVSGELAVNHVHSLGRLGRHPRPERGLGFGRRAKHG